MTIDKKNIWVEKIEEYAKSYAQDRVKNQELSLVGQFCDAEGCRKEQSGIYGMSCWLIITKNIYNDTEVTLLRNEILKKYNEYLDLINHDFEQLSGDKRTNDDPDLIRDIKNARDLYHLTPKLCFSIAAFGEIASLEKGKIDESIINAFGEVEKKLIGFFRKFTANKNEGSGVGWSNDPQGTNPLATAFALKLVESSISDNEKKKYAAYLKKEIKYTNFTKEAEVNKLFILNIIFSLVRSNPTEGLLFRKQITTSLKKTFKELYTNPTSLSNPVNMDFQDQMSNRNRYIRLPTDVIILESLIIIGGDLYLRSGIGRVILNNITKTLDKTEGQNNIYFLSKDTTNNRPSFTTYQYIYDVLSDLSEFIYPLKKINRKRILYSKLLYVTKFSPIAEQNAFGLAFNGLLALIVYLLTKTIYDPIFLAIAGATLPLLGNIVYSAYEPSSSKEQ